MGDERFAPYFRGMPSPWNFASVGDTEARLARAGFEVSRVWLERKSVTPDDPRDFVRVMGLANHLDRLPEELHDAFIDAALGSMAAPPRRSSTSA